MVRSSLRSSAEDTFRFSQARAFINFYWVFVVDRSMSTVDRRIGRLQREWHRRAIDLRTSTPVNRSIPETETERENRCTGSVKKWGLLRESRLSTDWRARPSACGHPRSGSYYRMVSVCTPARHFDIPIYPPVHECRIHSHARTREIDKVTLRLAHLLNSAI